MSHKLHVAGLDSATTTEDLHTIFSNYGTVIDCAVVYDKYGSSRKFGFVAYDSLAAAKVLLDGTSGPIMIHGVVVDIMPAADNEVETKENSARARPAMVSRKLFIGGLHGITTNESLKTAFLKFGVVTDAVAMVTRTGEARGFGFVTMKDPSVAQALIGTPMLLDGNSIEVKPADGLFRQQGDSRLRRGRDDYPSYVGESTYKRPRRDTEYLESEYEAPVSSRSWHREPYPAESRQPHQKRWEGPAEWSSDDAAFKIFIRKLPSTVNKERLKLLCSQFGDVKDADVKTDRGVGFVVFVRAGSAGKAIDAGTLEIDGQMTEIHPYGRDTTNQRPPEECERRPSYHREEENDHYHVPNRTALDRMQFLHAKQVAPSRRVEEPKKEREAEFKHTPWSAPWSACDRSRDERHPGGGSGSCGSAKIFVGNVSLEMTNERFRQYWDEVVGDVADCVTMPGRGFGFVTFNSKEIAEEVLTQTHVINGRDCNLVPADGGGRFRQPSADEKNEELEKGKLFVGQLSFSVTKDEFTDAFLQFGALVDVSCYPARGFGFVQYEDKQAAQYAMTQEVWFHGKKARISPCEIPMRNKK
eukprot:GEMP01009963.1.p1 GENE.GEMP01009963.1~~GEMP01009963.1.p1  ORF type:complete len:585 (+),score=124.59 GEMP01009963.1:133-1887(+)